MEFIASHFYIWLPVVLLIAVAWGVQWFLNYCERYSPADWGSRNKNGIAGLLCLFVYRYHHLSYDTIPLPDSGCGIVVANHISGLDPLLLVAASSRPLRFLIAQEQYQRFGLRWLFRLGGCIPVEREARSGTALREALRALGRGEVVALFPHGKIHLDTDPPRNIKGGAIRLAQLSQCQIYPVHIKDTKAQGHTLLAIPIPSQASLKVKPAFYCQQGNTAKDLKKLTCLISSHER
ncbi:MAG: 1-acyl-sn-glycerol-3-phosphate acyltransferase [Gammaproteobacteria bacterium]|nr:1-acyl-sn-glycerol-3-phosphate acyltransferase [Gammaproteobacteria bacterium]